MDVHLHIDNANKARTYITLSVDGIRYGSLQIPTGDFDVFECLIEGGVDHLYEYKMRPAYGPEFTYKRTGLTCEERVKARHCGMCRGKGWIFGTELRPCPACKRFPNSKDVLEYVVGFFINHSDF